jgi:hypothetical protein
MPIRPFLNGEQFDRETLRILGVAFEQVCIGLRIGDCGDDVKNAIARKIIERKPASAILIYYASTLCKTFAKRKCRAARWLSLTCC